MIIYSSKQKLFSKNGSSTLRIAVNGSLGLSPILLYLRSTVIGERNTHLAITQRRFIVFEVPTFQTLRRVIKGKCQHDISFPRIMRAKNLRREILLLKYPVAVQPSLPEGVLRLLNPCLIGMIAEWFAPIFVRQLNH